MAQTLPTSEVLHLAADEVQRRGWTVGNSGWMGAGWAGPVCIEGAIDAALGGVRDTDPHAFWTCPAYRAVAAYLGVVGIGGPRRSLWWWNDAYDEDGRYIRTAAEVIEVLRATAAIEASREDAALLAEIGRA